MDATQEEMALQVSQLLETVAILQEQIARTRNSNRILRIVNRSLREQLNIAHLNDELMKELCTGDIHDYSSEDGTLSSDKAADSERSL